MPHTAPLFFRRQPRLVLLVLLSFMAGPLPLSAKDKEIVETIAPDDTLQPNPFIGFVTDTATFYETPAVPQSLAIRTVTWAELEPERDKIDFARLEKDWAPHLKLGRRIGIRLRTADPFSDTPVDIPQWLVDRGVTLRPYRLDGGEGQAPDWNNPKFQDEHTRLIKRLGEKYNRDPRVAWIDIGSYGFWGEWHVYKHPDLAATDDAKRQMIDSFRNAFPDKCLTLPAMDHDASRYAVDRDIGLRANYIGSDEDNKSFLDSLTRIDPDLPETLFHTGLCGGEFSGGDDGARATVADAGRFQATLDFIQKAHLSFLGPTGGHLLHPPADHRDRLEAIARRLGYRFRFSQFSHPEQVRIGDTLPCRLVLRNDGVAVFPHPWPVSIRMTSTDTNFTHAMTPFGYEWDIRNWIPGEWSLDLDIHYTRSDRFQPGLYTLWIAILDPDTGRPGVHFAQTGRAPDDSPAAGYYKLGTVKVVK